MELKTLICVLVVLSLSEAGKISYEGYKVLRLVPRDDGQLYSVHQLEEISEIKLDFWSDPKSVNQSVDVMVDPLSVDSLTRVLESFNIPHSVIIHDVQTLIQEETQRFDSRSSTSKSGINWTAFHRIADINRFLDQLAATHSDIAEVFSIGKSYEGRPLKVIKIGKPKLSTKPAIWIDAGIHAREWIAPATATYIINQLVNNYAENRELVDEIDWYILPSVNPDGYEHSHTVDRMWRKTRSGSTTGCRGTDANRNFAYHWNEGGSSSSACSDTYHGPRAFSEPETKAVSDFILKNKNQIKLYLSFHSYGQMWLTPWGYTSKLPADYNDLVALAKKATNKLYSVYGTSYRIGTSTNVLYVATGGSDDWAKGVAGIKYAYTVELRDAGRYGFTLPPRFIQPTVAETWEAVKVIGNEIPNLV